MMHISVSDYKYNGNITIWVHCGFTNIETIFVTFYSANKLLPRSIVLSFKVSKLSIQCLGSVTP